MDKNNSKPDNDHLNSILAGGFSATISRFIGQPFEIMKVRFQAQEAPPDSGPLKTEQHVHYRSIPHAVSVIMKEEGILGFWRGHNMAQFQGLCQSVVTFWSFEQVRHLFRQTPMGGLPTLCNFLSGFTSGAVAVLTLTPFDMVKARYMQCRKKKQTTVSEVVKEIYKAGGIYNFYKGTVTAIIHVGFLIGGKFMFYNLFCDISGQLTQIKTRKELPTPYLLVSGAAAGFAANFATYPMDLIKRRLQKHAVDIHLYERHIRCAAIIQCIRVTCQREGIRGLYKGVVPCVLKSAVSTSLQFSAYDRLKTFFAQYT